MLSTAETPAPALHLPGGLLMLASGSPRPSGSRATVLKARPGLPEDPAIP